MFILKSIIALTLVCAVAVLSGCVTSGSGFACNSVVTKEAKAPAPEPKTQIVMKEVPGPERIVYRDREVIKEVPGPERIVIKEVEVPAVPTKAVSILPLVVIPGALFDSDKSTLKPNGVVEMHNAAKI